MSLRIAVGGFMHESHSFAPRPTRYADFLRPGGFPPLVRGQALFDGVRGTSVPIAGAVEGPVTAMNPASALQLHPHVTLCLDEAAATELRMTEYYRWVYDQKPDWQKA